MTIRQICEDIKAEEALSEKQREVKGMQAMYWLIALAVLLLIEIVTLGLTTIWFAGGSLIAFLVAIFGGPFWLQFVLFFIVSLLLLLFTRPAAVKYINRSRIRTNYESMPGREGRVIERIDNFNESGTVVVGGQEWSARAIEDGIVIEAGAKVFVREIRGVKLIVEEREE